MLLGTGPAPNMPIMPMESVRDLLLEEIGLR